MEHRYYLFIVICLICLACLILIYVLMQIRALIDKPAGKQKTPDVDQAIATAAKWLIIQKDSLN